MNQCKYIKSNNQRCKSYRLREDDYCYFHSNKTSEARRESVLRGGESIKRNYGRSDEIVLKTSEDVIILLEQTANDLRSNKTNPKTANALGYLATVALRAIEQSDLERRIETLEYAYKIKTQTK